MNFLTSVPPQVLSALIVDLSAIRRNYRTLRRTFSGEKVGAMIKDNAYALGVEGIAPALAQEGCRDFFVSTIEEGMDVKRYIPQEASVYILNGAYQGAEDLILQHNFIPTLITYEQIERWAALAQQKGIRLKTVIHIDTGMSRTGLSEDETERLIQNLSLLDKLDIQYWMSHLACSDLPDHPMNQRQLERFHAITQRLPKAPKSFVNSDGIFLEPRYHFDLARPGLSLYGLNTMSDTLEPAIELHAKILQIRDVKAGDSIGYEATYTFDKPGRVGILPVGYAQGTSTHLSNLAHVAIEGTLAPIRGRVSMDLMGIDISHFPKNKIKENQWVEVLGKNISPKALAKAGRTITYEIILCIRNHFKVYRED